jgi:hypothetical protein
MCLAYVQHESRVAGDVRFLLKGSRYFFKKPDRLKLPGCDVCRFLGIMFSG